MGINHARERNGAAAAMLAAALAGFSAGCDATGGTPSDAVATPPAGEARAPAAPVDPEAAPQKKEVVPLAESEVPRSAIAVDTRVRTIRSLAVRTREMDAIAASEPSVLRSVEALKGWMRSREPRQQTPRALRSFGQEWAADEATLGAWMETTGQRLDALSAAAAELRELKSVWTATEATLKPDTTPVEIRDRVRGILDSIQEPEKLINAEVDKILVLQSRISTARLDAEEALDTIAVALWEGHTRLLQLDSPPLWKSFGPGSGREPVLRELEAALAEGRRALKQYAANAPQTLWFQLASFVLLTVAFFRLRPGSRTWPADDRAVRACARLVQRPVLGAALVALLGGLLFHPRAPLVFYELTSVLLVVPVVVVLHGIVRPALRGVLDAVALIFVAERIWETTWAGSFLERMVLLGLTILSAAVLVWTIRPRAPFPEVVARRWWGATIVVGRVALAALAVAVVSNLVGNVSLARLLTTTVVRAGYAGVVLFAAALLLRGTAALLVRLAAASSFRAIERHADLILRRAALVIDTSMVFLFLYFVLTAANFVPIVRATLELTLTRPWRIGTFQFSVASVLMFVVALLASILVSRVVRALLEEDVYPRVTLARGVPDMVTMLVRYGVITLGFLLALSLAGIPLDRFAFALGALGVGIGFGLQTVVNNFVSGLILIFERPIQVGDAIEVEGLLGRVRRIGVRASTVETYDGAEVIVPNGTLVSSQLINWTLSSRSRRVEIPLSVTPDTDPEKVLALLREATAGIPGVLGDPKPKAIVRGFGTGSIDLSVEFWTDDFDGWTSVRSAAAVKISHAMREAGIKTPEAPS